MHDSSSEGSAESNRAPYGAFPFTSWTMVQRVADCDEAVAFRALEALVELYRQPLQSHLLRRWPRSPEQAEDWLQSFLYEKVVRDGLIRRARRERGRFRTFLLNALDNFVASELRKANAIKRPPDAGRVSIDDVAEQVLATNDCAEWDAVGMDWVRVVVAETVKRMEVELRAKNQARHWEVFKTRVFDPIFDGSLELPYGALVKRFGFRSPTEAYNMLITAKRTFSRVLGEVVGDYERDAGAVSLEIEEFKALLARLAGQDARARAGDLKSRRRTGGTDDKQDAHKP